MAGLVAAVRSVELGGSPIVYEKGGRLGGSMLLSSGVIWRHAHWQDFRRECPGGDEALQRALWDRLDDALAWLADLGAPVVRSETGNPRTVGVRFDTAGLRDELASRLPPGGVAAGAAPLEVAGVPTVLATGGFAASPELVDRFIAPAAPLRLRANPWSTGDGLRHGLERGAMLSAGMDEFYGRNMPAAAWGEGDYVRLAQLYAHRARIFDETGIEFFRPDEVSWSQTNVVQATARRAHATAYYVLDRRGIDGGPGEPSLAAQLEEVPAASRLSPAQLPFDPPRGAVVAVRVQASITHSIGGLRADAQARVLGADGPLEGLFAAGVDVGGVATGGYASGLATALVLGLAAGESATALA